MIVRHVVDISSAPRVGPRIGRAGVAVKVQKSMCVASTARRNCGNVGMNDFTSCCCVCAASKPWCQLRIPLSIGTCGWLHRWMWHASLLHEAHHCHQSLCLTAALSNAADVQQCCCDCVLPHCFPQSRSTAQTSSCHPRVIVKRRARSKSVPQGLAKWHGRRSYRDNGFQPLADGAHIVDVRTDMIFQQLTPKRPQRVRGPRCLYLECLCVELLHHA